MKFWYDGYYDHMKGHARRRGIPIKTVEVRCHRYGNRPENYDRILFIGQLGPRLSRVDGRLDTFAGHSRHAGLDPKTVASRTRRGLTLEQALASVRIRQVTQRKRRELAAFGIIV